VVESDQVAGQPPVALGTRLVEDEDENEDQDVVSTCVVGEAAGREEKMDERGHGM
jgi:hypothetical protein